MSPAFEADRLTEPIAVVRRCAKYSTFDCGRHRHTVDDAHVAINNVGARRAVRTLPVLVDQAPATVADDAELGDLGNVEPLAADRLIG